MAIFVFGTKKTMEIAAYMDEGMRNVILVGGLLHPSLYILPPFCACQAATRSTKNL